MQFVFLIKTVQHVTNFIIGKYMYFAFFFCFIILILKKKTIKFIAIFFIWKTVSTIMDWQITFTHFATYIKNRIIILSCAFYEHSICCVINLFPGHSKLLHLIYLTAILTESRIRIRVLFLYVYLYIFNNQ